MLTIALIGLIEVAILYGDDIIVFSCTLQYHNEDLKTVIFDAGKWEYMN